MNRAHHSRSLQQGAALVIGMILLLVLTVLAISGMGSATMELVLAGNEQYRQNAFQAAEVGIGQTISQAAFNPAATQTFAGASGGDSYSATISPAGVTDGMPGQPASLGKYTTYHFDIQSTGSTALNNARALNVQGVAWGSVKDNSGGPSGGAGGPPGL